MTTEKLHPYARPLTIAVLLFGFYCVQNSAKGKELPLMKAALVGSWFLLSVVLLVVVQLLRKKEFGWMASFIGVLGGSLIVAVTMLVLKSEGLISL